MKKILTATIAVFLCGCTNTHTISKSDHPHQIRNSSSDTKQYDSQATDRIISRKKYLDQLEGFWLGESIANWTGLITEMDKVKPPFYTSKDWGKPDQKNIWGNYVPHSKIIDFYFLKKGSPWGADDDTDLEYIYQDMLEKSKTILLTPEQIRDGWLEHIYSNEDAPLFKMFPDSKPERENFLWVSNEKAYYLMKSGVLPPATSEPENNPNSHSIDAQLTTEIFGLFAPARPDIALKIAELPIRVTAKDDSEWAAKFYVIMYSLATASDEKMSMRERIYWMADQARALLPNNTATAKMYDFVKTSYINNPDKNNWEKTRDEVYEYYQKTSHDGYVYKEGFDSGINFAASIVSLYYGEGDFLKTIKIGALMGWDSDNPTATWGGLLGFMLGKGGIELATGQRDLSDTYWIGRTRRNFPDRTPDVDGDDSFHLMAERGLTIVDRVIKEQMGGSVDTKKDVWIVPIK